MIKFLLTAFILLSSCCTYATAQLTSTTTNKRIVVLEFSLLDDLNLLGIKPVGIGTSGASFEGADPDYLHTIIINTPSVGAREAPNLEAIAKLKPDIIIGDIDFNNNIKSQLNKIAPTVLLKGIFGLPEQQIKNLKTLADLTNTADKTAAIIRSYDDKYIQVKNITQSSKSVNVLIGFPTANNSFNALANNSITTQILANLGKRNMITQNTSSQLFTLSVEGLLAKNPEQIVILLTNQDYSAYYNLKKNPLWQHLSAVKNNKIYFADRNIWAKSHGIEALELMYQQGIESGFFANIPAKGR